MALAADDDIAVAVRFLRTKSSTPRTRGVSATGSGKAMTSDNIVVRLTGADSTEDNRAPGSPASATPAASKIRRRAGVRRPYRTVTSGTCSANATRAQPPLSQNNRRTQNSMTTWRPPIALSASRRP